MFFWKFEMWMLTWPIDMILYWYFFSLFRSLRGCSGWCCYYFKTVSVFFQCSSRSRFRVTDNITCHVYNSSPDLPLPILSSVYGIVFVTNNRLQLTSWRPEEAILNVSIAWSDSPHYWHTLHWYAQCTYDPISTDNLLVPPMNNSVLTMDGQQRSIGNCLCKQIVTLPTSHHHRHRQNTALPSIMTRNLVVISIYRRKARYCCKDVR